MPRGSPWQTTRIAAAAALALITASEGSAAPHAMTCIAAHGSYDVRLAEGALQFTDFSGHATVDFPVIVLRERAAASSISMSGADYRFIAHFGVRKRMEFFVNGRLVGTDPCS